MERIYYEVDISGKFFLDQNSLSDFLVFPFFFFIQFVTNGRRAKENEFVLENRMEQKLDEALPVISLDTCHSMSSLTLES